MYPVRAQPTAPHVHDAQTTAPHVHDAQRAPQPMTSAETSSQALLAEDARAHSFDGLEHATAARACRPRQSPRLSWIPCRPAAAQPAHRGQRPCQRRSPPRRGPRRPRRGESEQWSSSCRRRSTRPRTRSQRPARDRAQGYHACEEEAAAAVLRSAEAETEDVLRASLTPPRRTARGGGGRSTCWRGRARARPHMA